jgi:3-methyladenine DNA glycosylase AlkD
MARITGIGDILTLLESERDARGVKHWETLGDGAGGMRSVGLGLTRLRQLAKGIGRDRALAAALWKTDLYEARVLALLIDDPLCP